MVKRDRLRGRIFNSPSIGLVIVTIAGILAFLLFIWYMNVAVIHNLFVESHFSVVTNIIFAIGAIGMDLAVLGATFLSIKAFVLEY